MACLDEFIESLPEKYDTVVGEGEVTLKNADRILFIENGKVKKEGTHEELLITCKSYKELYESEIEK